MRPIEHRTLSRSVRASVREAARAIRWAVRTFGPGASVHAFVDDPEAPVLEVRDSAGFTHGVALPPSCLSGLDLYIRQWWRA